MVDFTPLYRMMGGSDKERAYFSIFGSYTDPLKAASNPVDFLESKTSPTTVKIPLEVLTAENWQHKTFTDVDELLGIDDKGEYAKTQKAHKKGDISPRSGKAYVRDQKGHIKGENKGGKLGGQLTKYDDKPHGGITLEQIPSFTLSQIRGMMPTGIQSIEEGVTGENDWARTLLTAPGTGVLFGKEGNKDNSNSLWDVTQKIYNAIKK
jgi:hypothetical protein